MANANLIVAGSRILASTIQSIAPLCVIKPTDQSLTSNTTLQNDNALFLPVAANATYIVVCYLDYVGASIGTGDLKFQWSNPAGSAMRYVPLYENASSQVLTQLTQLGSDVINAGSNGAGNLRSVLMVGSLIMSSTAGNMQFTWAQNSSNGTATIVHAQSFLALWRIT